MHRLGKPLTTGELMAKAISTLASQLGAIARARAIKIVTAESCTGGGIAQAITAIAGSSAWFDRGLVVYSNAAKIQLLQVKPATLARYGAVSQAVAIAMAEGALLQSDAGLAIAITGIAGPSGGSVQKPVGTVFIACQLAGHDSLAARQLLTGDRLQIRQQAVGSALALVLDYLTVAVG